MQASPQKTTIDYIDWNCAQDCDGQAVGYQANPTTLGTNRHSFVVQGLPPSAISIQNNLPSTLLEPNQRNLVGGRATMVEPMLSPPPQRYRPRVSRYPTFQGLSASDPGWTATVASYCIPAPTFAPSSGFEDLPHPLAVCGPVSDFPKQNLFREVPERRCHRCGRKRAYGRGRAGV